MNVSFYCGAGHALGFFELACMSLHVESDSALTRTRESRNARLCDMVVLGRRKRRPFFFAASPQEGHGPRLGTEAPAGALRRCTALSSGRPEATRSEAVAREDGIGHCDDGSRLGYSSRVAANSSAVSQRKRAPETGGKLQKHAEPGDSAIPAGASRRGRP
jgi:hypothetical protein